MVGTHEKERKQCMEEQGIFIERILSNENMNRAYKQVKKNKGHFGSFLHGNLCDPCASSLPRTPICPFHLYFFVKSRKRAGNDRGLSAGRRGEYSCQAAVSFSWIRRLLQLPFPGKRIILKLQKTGTFSSDVPVFCNCSRNYSVATVPRGVLA